MGICKLWADLRQAHVVEEVAWKEDELSIAKEVDGLVVAIDVSIWVFQVSLRVSL